MVLHLVYHRGGAVVVHGDRPVRVACVGGSGFFFVLEAGVRWFAGGVMSSITDMSPLLEPTLWIWCLSGMLILRFDAGEMTDR